MIRPTLYALLVILAGCGGGGGGDSADQGPTQADRCAATLDAVTLIPPHSDWATARAQLPAADPVLVAEARALWRSNHHWASAERDACYAYVGYVPGTRASKATVARRMAEMASTIRGQCEGDEKIGEC